MLAAATVLAAALVATALHADIFPVRSQLWHQGSPDVEGQVEAGDRFGWALAAGDFNLDGYDDLVVGIPYEDVGVLADAGAIAVLFGGPGGLSGAGDQLLDQSSSGDPATVEAGDHFGYALATLRRAAGDWLAVGAPGETLNSLGLDSVGVVHRYLPSAGGLVGDIWISQETTGIAGDGADGEQLGSALATGDFDQNGTTPDLAVGVPYDRSDIDQATGSVNILYEFDPYGDTLLHPWYLLAGDGSYNLDQFGAALAAGDFDCDDYDDLAIGSPNAAVQGVANAGSVNVVYGGLDGLSPSYGNQEWDQGTTGIEGAPAQYDGFGRSLVAGNFDGGCDDLAIGVPGETVAAHGSAGAVSVLYGSFSSGLSASLDELLSYSGGGLDGDADTLADLGSALTAADLDGDSLDDLVIGVPGANVFHDMAVVGHAGAVQIVHGTIYGLALSTRQSTWHAGLPGTVDAPEADAGFGSALAVGDFDGNGHPDLAVGAPYRTVSGQADAGAVYVYYGALFADGFESGFVTGWSGHVP